jgi:Nucleotidyltransferase domain
MDPRLAAAPQVLRLAELLSPRGDVDGVYVGGSLASGDYHPGTSDLDVVVLTRTALTRRDRRRLRSLHRSLDVTDPSARALHCAYVPRDAVGDASTPHPVWAGGELFARPLSGIGRAELLADPVVVHGPAPDSWLPAMDTEAVKAAARAELAGYWSRAVRRRRIWRQDVYVDLGLLTVARAQATLAEGRLITKREAIERLPLVGVDPDLADEVARRRAGERVVLGPRARRRRARRVRSLVATAIGELLATP